MIRMEFSEEEREALHQERFNHPHPRIQLKMEVVYLKSCDLSTSEIARLTRVCENTVRSYLIEYQEGGIDRLREIRFRRPESELKNHAETLKAYFQEHPPASINQAKAIIEEITGISRSLPQVGHFMKTLGMDRRKAGMVPAKADPEKQEAFKKRA